MTVTDLHGREDLANLGQRAEDLHARLMDQLHQDVRAALNESKITEKSRLLDDALDIFDKAQKDRRDAEQAEANARDSLEQAEVAARWEASTQVTNEGNKFFVPNEAPKGQELAEPRRQVTAAVRDEWIETQVRKDPTVTSARAGLRRAEHHTAECKDALERARIAISIRRTQAELAGIHVQAIAGTLRSER